jgi:cytidylate kinase
MKTFIKFFEKDEEKFKKTYKHEGMTITVSGLASSGKTTGAKAIAKHFNLKYHSAGSIFRNMAEKLRMSVEDFSKIREDEIDIEVDKETLRLAIIGNVVLDGRLTGLIAGKWAEVRVFYNTPLEIRAKRFAEREKIDYEAALKKVKERDESDIKKYKKLYGVDLEDLSLYDIVIDNSNWSLEDANKKPIELIEDFLRKRGL